LEVIRDKLFQTEVKTTFIEENDTKNEKMYFADANRNCKNSNEIKNLEISPNDKNLIEKLENKRTELLSKLENKRTELLLEEVDEQTRKTQLGWEKIKEKRKQLEWEKVDNENIRKHLKWEIKKIEDKYNLIQKSENFVILNENAWFLLEEKIANYDNERLKYMDRLSNKLLNIADYGKDEFKQEMQEWESKNENVVEQISDKLNPILNKFNLELAKIDPNQKSYNDLTIKDLSNENIIKYENLSTGTKNLIATFIPLKIHNPKDSIILIDEPENSFYPDIQRKLTELYMEVGENNQVIFATHSPLIASSFEPWEVVELKFDKNNQVYREKYFEGDIDHIDNYTLDPRMLTWTGILTDIFDIKSSSNSDFRENALIEFNILKEEIKNIEDIEKKEELFKKLQNLGKKLGIYNQ